MKSIIALFAILTLSSVFAAEDYICTRPGSTASYGVDLSGYKRGDRKFYVIRKLQAPQEIFRMYEDAEEFPEAYNYRTELVNNDFQSQADRRVTLRESPEKITLEIRLKSGPKKSVLYECKTAK